MNKTINCGRYRHYKGKEYTVIGLAKHSETMEDMVIYQKEYDDYSMWIRPLSVFTENVIVDGKEVPRFTFLYKEEDYSIPF